MKKRKKEESPREIYILHNGEKVKLNGFYTFHDEKTGEILLAVKWRHDKGLIIYYIKENCKDKKIQDILQKIRQCNFGNYEIINIKTALEDPEIYLEERK